MPRCTTPRARPSGLRRGRRVARGPGWPSANCKTRRVKFRASEVARGVGGELIGDDVLIDGVTIDSRTVKTGELFVPVVAERDGHRFIPAAIAGGAAAYLTQA